MAQTIDEVVDELLDNADFEEVGSTSKATAFITAAKRFFILSPEQQAHQGSMMRVSVPQIERLMTRAQHFVDINSGRSSRVRFLSAAGGFRR